MSEFEDNNPETRNLSGLEDAAVFIHNQKSIRSVISHKSNSVRSRLSNVSRTQSQILILEKQKQLKEQQFIELQKRQQEIDDFEIKLMEKQREHLIKRKVEAEAYFLEKQKIDEEIMTKEAEMLDELEDQHNLDFEDDLFENNPYVPRYPTAHQQPVLTAQQQPVPPPIVNPTSNVKHIDQRDEVLSAAFKALQSQQIKDLPTFTGENLLDWPFFVGEFERTTAELNISESDNLIRLQKALQGKARLSVQHLLTNPKFVDQIIRILNLNFGRTEWVMTEIVERLESLPIVREDHLEDMRDFYNQIFGFVHAAKDVNGKDYLGNPLLVVQLSEKLPPFSRNAWNRCKANMFKKNQKVTIEEFLTWLEQELEIAFAGYNPIRSKSVSHKYCRLCKSNNHWHLKDCSKFLQMDIDERRITVRKLRCCFRCLNYGHDSNTCNSTSTCNMCAEVHHPILH